MTHGKCLSYLNSAVFADTVVPSGRHRTIIRWLYDGITRASRSHVAFRRHSGSFLFPSYCLREAISARWHRWSHEVITIWQDAITMALRRATWTHEYNTKMNLRKVFGQFIGTPSCCRSLKIDRQSYDRLRCPHEWPDMARCVYDQSRIWNFPSSCVHLMSTSGQCDASITNTYKHARSRAHALAQYTHQLIHKDRLNTFLLQGLP